MTTKRERQWAALGSVSHGTMREEDLIPAFEGVLDDMGVGYDQPAAVARLLDGEEELTDAEWEAVGWYVHEELHPLLDSLAPPYAYFGSHEGDGADYGFWPCMESLEEDWQERDGSGEYADDGRPVAKVDAGEDWSACTLPGFIAYVAEVTDHGNVTLYTRDGVDVWSVV